MGPMLKPEFIKAMCHITVASSSVADSTYPSTESFTCSNMVFMAGWWGLISRVFLTIMYEAGRAFWTA